MCDKPYHPGTLHPSLCVLPWRALASDAVVDKSKAITRTPNVAQLLPGYSTQMAQSGRHRDVHGCLYCVVGAFAQGPPAHARSAMCPGLQVLRTSSDHGGGRQRMVVTGLTVVELCEAILTRQEVDLDVVEALHESALRGDIMLQVRMGGGGRRGA